MQAQFKTAAFVVVCCMLVAAPALAQGDAPQRLNWFWSIFAGFVLAGMGIATFAWLFGLTRLHWLVVLIAWAAVTYLLRYHASV